MKKLLNRIQKARHSLYWQLVLTMTGTCFLACLIILAARCISAVDDYAKMDSGSVLAGTVQKITTTPGFKEFSVSRWKDESAENKDDFPAPPADQALPADIDANNVIDLGIFMRDSDIDFRFFPQETMQMMYFDADGNIYPIIRRENGPEPGRDENHEPLNIDSIIDKGRELIERSDGGQIIVPDGEASAALIPHRDAETGEEGYFFIYVDKPARSGMITGIVKMSVKEMLPVICAVLFLSLLIGMSFSQGWTHWFRQVRAAMDSWEKGDFSKKIDSDKVPFVKEWQDLAEQLNDMSEQLEQVIETRRELAASEERNSLARELHDNIKQQLFSINMNLGAAQVLAKKDDPRAMEKLELSTQMTQQALMDLDQLIGTIRAPAMKDKKLYRELLKLTENWQKSSGIALETDIEDAETITNEEISSAIFRICQEGLSNILRHSRADKARLYLKADELGINLLIKDNGIGFDLSGDRDGMGIDSMRERVKKLNGTVDIKSGSGGTAIKVYIPRKVSV